MQKTYGANLKLFFYYYRSFVVTRGHSWSLVVTRGHSWSLVVTRGHSWSFVCTFRQDQLKVIFLGDFSFVRIF
jgi:hypothetical protein